MKKSHGDSVARVVTAGIWHPTAICMLPVYQVRSKMAPPFAVNVEDCLGGDGLLDSDGGTSRRSGIPLFQGSGLARTDAKLIYHLGTDFGFSFLLVCLSQ